MTGVKTVLCLIGTRPEAIKMAPLLRALQSCSGFRCLCCLSGQHGAVVDSTLALFQIRPDYRLDALRPGQDLAFLTQRIYDGFSQLLEDVQPDLVLVHGDTATAFAGAMAAYHKCLPLGHVEAGLRSGDPTAPFPEEIYRQMIARMVRLHFAPSQNAVENLRREKVSGEIICTGNTVLDALDAVAALETEPLQLLGVEEGCRLILLTCHRRENRDHLPRILGAVRTILEGNPDVRLVIPMHPDPALRRIVSDFFAGDSRVVLLSDVPVAQMHDLLAQCYLALTDSGGLQEEAPALGKPVLVLRSCTERPECVEAGAAELVGADPQRIINRVNFLLHNPDAYEKIAQVRRLYGDGHASEKIVAAIIRFFEE